MSKTPTVEEADAFLSMTLYADLWARQTPENKQRSINSAQTRLIAAYPGIQNRGDYVDMVYYQAAFQLSPYYTAAQWNISSRSVSDKSVSESFGRGTARNDRALFADEIVGVMGDPYKPAGSGWKKGRLY